LKEAKKTRVIVSVTNDLATDNRVHKVCSSLVKFGFEVLLVGRKLPDSPEIEKRTYQTRRFHLLFTKGPFFYGCYNLRLFFFLFFQRSQILLSNDLDTLPANYLASTIRNKKLVFDSHEYFTEVPELIHRPRTQKIWKTIERRILPHIKYAYTVCDSIADLYQKEYNVLFRVIRNAPEKNASFTIPTEKILPTNKKIILYQGAVNLGRGLPEVISAMQYMDKALLLIVGNGDILEDLRKEVRDLSLEEKVLFTGRLPVQEVRYYTAQADLGLSIEQDMGLNYRYALPNKLFDYIGAGVPVLVSNLPEMARLVKHYRIGMIMDSHAPKELAEKLTEALHNQDLRTEWKKNLRKASSELTWNREEKILAEVFTPLKVI